MAGVALTDAAKAQQLCTTNWFPWTSIIAQETAPTLIYFLRYFSAAGITMLNIANWGLTPLFGFPPLCRMILHLISQQPVGVFGLWKFHVKKPKPVANWTWHFGFWILDLRFSPSGTYQCTQFQHWLQWAIFWVFYTGESCCIRICLIWICT